MDKAKYITAQFEQHLLFWESQLKLSSGKFVFSTAGSLSNPDRLTAQHTLSAENAAFIKQLVKGNTDGIFVVFLSAAQLLFSRLSLQDEVVLDFPAKQYSNPDLNALFIIQQLRSDQHTRDLLVANQNLYRQSVQFQALPVGVLDESLIRDTLSNIILSYEALHGVVDHGLHDLHLQLKNDGDQLIISANANPAMIDQALLEKVIGLFDLVFQFMQQTDRPFSELALGSLPAETDAAFQASFPDITIHQQVAAVAKRFPNHVAVQFGAQQITYHDLNHQAGALAQVLVNEKGIKPGDYVALLLDRSAEMIIAMLAVLKAGAVYVPIDPEYPSDRIDFMFRDSGAKVLVTEKACYETKLPDLKAEILLFSALDLSDRATPFTEVNLSPEAGAYVIYTSGSTGNPKGVLVSHRNVIRLLINSHFQFEFNENDTWTLFHSFCFDFSVWEMYGPLFYGGKCLVVPKEIARSTQDFVQLVHQEGVTVLNQTPGAFYNFIFSASEQALDAFKLRYVIFGGEALQPRKLEAWHQQHPNVKLINMYGITETTVHVTFKEITATEIASGASNIGSCIPTLEALVLDQRLQPQASGFAGELFVGGAGLAIKYLNLPELTQERFIPHPFRAGEKLYRTGDLARTSSNGELEYLGRIDFQVKIRGFRIETGEIENQLLQLPQIQEAVVIARKSEDDHYLAAYLVARAGMKIQDEEIRKQLQAFLPDYMIPAFLIEVEKIPLTGNGKVNRALLPDPLTLRSVQTPYVAPESSTEKDLAKIWEELLNLSPIGKKHHFFRSGGHSLMATRLISKIRGHWHVDLNLGEIFQFPVLEDLATHIAAGKSSFATLVPVEDRPFYPLSAAQRRMFVLDQFEDVGKAYNMPAALILRGQVDENRIRKALQELIRRHDALRTSFRFEDGEPVQVIADQIELELEIKEVIGADFDSLFESFVRKFNLEKAPLFRTALIRFEADSWYFFFDMHHIISDFISMQIITHEFLALYNEKELDPITIQYRDFAVWQNGPEAELRLKEQEAYWAKRFEGGLSVLDIPTDFPRPHIKSFAGDTYHYDLGAEQKNALRSLADESGATMYMTFLALFNIFLSKYANNTQVVVGSPVNGRPIPEFDHVVGFFVNTLALRSEIDKKISFKDYLINVKDQTIQDFNNQDYPFEKLVAQLNVSQDLSRNPVFDIMYTYVNLPDQEESLQDVQAHQINTEHRFAKFDLLLNATDMSNKVVLSFEYATTLFKPETIERMTRHFVAMIDQVIANPQIELAQIALFTPQDETVLKQINQTALTVDYRQTAMHQFAHAVATHPDNTALVCATQRLTYREFDRRVSLLASQLRHAGVTKGDYVAIISSPSCEMIVAVFAVLRAGAAFLPIDTALPQDRVQYMLDDSKAKAIISFGAEQRYADMQIVLEDFDWEQSVSDANWELPTDQDLAYLIYTSGSTGLPKGVKINHHGLSNVVAWNIDEQKINATSSGTKYAGFSFDASIIEIFPLITQGATMHIISNQLRLDLDQLVNYFNQEKITHTFLPTKIAEQIIDYDLPHMTCLVTGGEKLNRYTPQPYRFLNTYGPTENSVDASWFEVTQQLPNIPIGKPIGNVRFYLREPDTLTPVGVGVPGELVITGESLAVGYHDRIELTDEKFITCPFESGSKMYLTGDLCRYLPDGNFEYLGRIDKQVKIRGYRIETGEIEQQLGQLDDVQEAVVLTRKVGGEMALVAYVVSKQFDAGNIKTELRKFLPDYMVPSYFIEVPEIPLTPNGKADNNKLAAIEIESGAAVTTPYVAPESALEKQLAEIWSQVLQIQKIGINDNFFELGGDSLKVVKLLKQLNDQFPGKFHISQLFDAATIAQQSDIIGAGDTAGEVIEDAGQDETRVIDF